MKKYLLSVFAIALALGFSAFTKAKFSTFVFQYTGPTSYTEAQVELNSNWTISTACTEDFGDEEKPCSFTVSGTSLADVNNHPVSSLVLEAVVGNIASKYVLQNVRQSGTPIQDEIVNLDVTP